MGVKVLGLVLLCGSVWAASMTNFTPVQTDLKALYRNSQAFWPADFNYYGPFFVRLAWHCTGSYRTSDGRGGCDGARQRFDPEQSWADNTNLDKARKLLVPIKLKYGDALSWGDLIVLAGTTAIGDMGGPVLGFCGGRQDDADGTASYPLGPTTLQTEVDPCLPTAGNCSVPIGTTTIGLIYVNPEGPFANPDPYGSAPQVRDTFNRMAMNDSETVALIGGGHAFGKTHGACPGGPGPDPDQQPNNPWPGTCGSGALFGKGANAYTSGFEGAWSTTPTTWSNEYFHNLLNFNWSSHVGPGGHYQWGNNVTSTMMLTTDISLTVDSTYIQLVNQFAGNLSQLEYAFMHAWYKLTSRDMGPVTRCIGSMVPPAQPFQYPLPSTPTLLANFGTVKTLIQTALTKNPDYVPQVIHLAYQSCSTFRQTDYLGGCNGARIRFSPQSGWQVNTGTAGIISFLKTNVMDMYTGSGALSYADLIVYAGQVGLEMAGANTMTFCSGRVDASDGDLGSQYLTPRSYNESNVTTTIYNVQDLNTMSGLTTMQWVALMGRPRSATVQQWIGYSGSWTTNANMISNAYYNVLLNYTWVMQTSANGKVEYMASGTSNIYMTPEDMVLIYDPTYMAIVQQYAANNTLYLMSFKDAWNTMVIADRFNGPTGNLCSMTTTTAAAMTTTTAAATSSMGAVIALAVILGIAVLVIMYLACRGGGATKTRRGSKNIPLTNSP